MRTRFLDEIDGASTLRQSVIALGILFVLLSITLFPYLYGGATLQDSVWIPGAGSTYTNGSRPVTHEEISRSFDPWAPALQAEPHFSLSHEIMLGEKTLPVWNPYSAYGEPLAAGMIAQPYSPFAWVAILTNSARGYNYFIALRLLVGGLFAFLLLRRFVSFLPALGGACAFMFAGDLWLYLSIQDLSVDVLLPALLYGAELVLDEPGFRSAGVFAVILGASVLGGHPEPVVLGTAFTALFVLARLAGDGRLRTQLKRIAPFAVLGIVVGGGLSAILWMPVLEYVPESFNLHSSLPWGSFTDTFEPVRAAQYLAPLIEGPLRRNIFSNFVGEIYLRGFFGCAAAFFALVAFFSRIEDIVERRERTRLPVLFFGITALVLLLKRFGFPLVNWIGYLPGFWRVYFTKYEEPVIACCVAILVAAGIAVLAERRASQKVLLSAAGVPLAIIAVVTLMLHVPVESLNAHQGYFALSVVGALVFLALAAMLFSGFAGRLSPRQLAACAVALVVLEPLCTYIFPLYYVLNKPLPIADSTLLGAPYLEFLKRNLKPGERVLGESGMLFPNWSSAFQIPDITALDALYPQRYLPFVQNLVPEQQLGDRYVGAPADFRQPGPQRFLALSSVRYVVAPYKMDQFSNRFAVVHSEDGAVVYAFRDALPRLALYAHTDPVKSGDDAMKRLQDARFQPAVEAVVEAPAASVPSGSSSPVRSGTIDVYRSRYVHAAVDTPVPVLAILSDTAFPGWNAYVDGKAAPTYRANYLFRGVPIAAGRHSLEFRYEPKSSLRGGIVTLASLLLVVGCFVWGTYGTRRRRELNRDRS